MRVSVTVPTYNSAETLRLALASLLIQTYDDWECIVVDDGSDDHTEAVVAAFEDPRFRYVRHTINQGTAVARQTALDACRGEFICMLDADDWCYPERLARLLGELDRYPEVGTVGSEAAIVDASGTCRGRTITAALKRTTLGVPVMVYPSAMFRRSLVAGFCFDPRYRRAQDKLLITHLVSRAPWRIVPVELYCYHFDFHNSAKAARSYLYAARYYYHRRTEDRWEAYRRTATSAGKALIHKAAHTLGFDIPLNGLTRIMQPMTPLEESDYHNHLESILSIYDD